MSTVTIGYLGPIGTYSHQAAMQIEPESEATLIPFHDISSLFDMDSKIGADSEIELKVDAIIVPFENTTGGSVGQCLDGFFMTHGSEYKQSNTKLTITKQCLLGIDHCLLKRKDAVIKRIYSHPEAFIQCSIWISNNLGNDIERIPCSSTADGARLAAQDSQAASISSLKCALLYGLEVVASGLAPSNNTTRFVYAEISRARDEQVVQDDAVEVYRTKLNLDAAYEAILLVEPNNSSDMSNILGIFSKLLRINRIFNRPLLREMW